MKKEIYFELIQYKTVFVAFSEKKRTYSWKSYVRKIERKKDGKVFTLDNKILRDNFYPPSLKQRKQSLDVKYNFLKTIFNLLIKHQLKTDLFISFKVESS